MGLSKGFSQNTFGDEQRDDTKMRGFELGPDGFGFGDHYLGGNIPWNVEKYGKSTKVLAMLLQVLKVFNPLIVEFQ